MTETRFQLLMHRYIAGEISPEEWAELSAMISSGRYDPLLQQLIADTYEAAEATGDMPAEKRQELLNRILTADPAPAYPSPRLQWRITRRWWAAAAVLAVLATSVIYFTRQQPPAAAPPLATVKSSPLKSNDVLPGSDKATLTLSDGSTVTLGAAGHQVIREKNTAIRRVNGQLQYKNGGAGETISYNTLATPRGGQYRLLLPDGTAVWLNAASSLRYPVAFTGNERKVELTGEAYFEVASNAAKPFRIHAGSQLIEVLGTHFNVNAYADEPEMKTSLLEGAVKVGSTVLQPGEQAHVTRNGNITVTRGGNIADAVAWKEGFFVFRNDNLQTVMREIARWYDVTVVYQPNINNSQQFSGRIDRSLTLAQVLSGLAATKAHFNIENDRNVVILP
ncbi:DUF4974 domain-containing protein [Chitinophaga agrisoli]|uniref:DUF4974 domain-containing protein n=1 Tax=Chitinophaga agrisoli TaxID=2607653 RepID=A0A5B2VSC8_9BACT|nr:FecR family protein [Chitinophaga agrisoli]KAA2242673.1 DUF4974 domain-containing protein [Chitinophaga agrisoli]